jgi:hypothetical protein
MLWVKLGFEPKALSIRPFDNVDSELELVVEPKPKHMGICLCKRHRAINRPWEYSKRGMPFMMVAKLEPLAVFAQEITVQRRHDSLKNKTPAGRISDWGCPREG